jgi:hypothetical protein
VHTSSGDDQNPLVSYDTMKYTWLGPCGLVIFVFLEEASSWRERVSEQPVESCCYATPPMGAAPRAGGVWWPWQQAGVVGRSRGSSLSYPFGLFSSLLFFSFY